MAKHATCAEDLWQYGDRDAKHAGYRLGPLHGEGVEQPRDAGVGGVGGVHPSPREPPQQETVHRAHQVAALQGTLPQPGNVLEGPQKPHCHQPGLEVEHAGGPVALLPRQAVHEVATHTQQLEACALIPAPAEVLSTGVFPGDELVQGLTRLPVPAGEGSALCGDTEGLDRPSRRRRVFEGLLQGALDHVPEVLGVHFELARRRALRLELG